MLKLQEVLQGFFGRNSSFFEFFQKEYTDGYCFWEIGKETSLLIDHKFAEKFNSEARQLELDDISNEDLRSALGNILEAIGNADEEEKGNNAFELQLLDKLYTVEISYFKLIEQKTGREFIFAALHFTDHFNSFSDSAVEMLDIALWKLNTQTNEFIVSHKFADLLGYSISEINPTSFSFFQDLIHPSDIEVIKRQIEDCQTGSSEEITGEYRLKHKNGNWVWLEIKMQPLTFSSEEDSKWIKATQFDITESKLRDQEKETLELIPLKSEVSVIITDAKGKITFVNKGFEELSGFNLQEVAGKKPKDFLQGPETSTQHKKALSLKMRSGEAFTQEILNYSKSGKKYWVSLSVNPIHDENGNIVKFISVQKDITQQKKYEKYLKTFKNTLDQTEDCVFIFDKDSFQFTYVNKGAELMMGYTAEELLDLHPYDIKPEYPFEKFKTLVEPLKSGEKSSIRFETFHRLKSGKDIPVEVFLQYIQKGLAKPHFVAIVHDITKKQQFEKEMQRLSLVAEKTQNLVVIADKKGLIEYVNPAFEQKTGYSLDEVIGKKPGYFLHGPETDPAHVQSNRENLKKLKPFTQEILNYTRSGEKYWVSITFSPVFNENNELTRFIAIEQEITERIEKENLLKESEERLQFVLEGSEIGYWDWEADTGKMIVNDRWLEMLGYKRGDFEVSIEKWNSLVHPKDMEKLNDIMQTVFPDPYSNEFNVEIRAKHKNGHYIWILDRGAVVERTKAGEPLRISGMHMEITDRKKLEEDLEEERRFMSKVISTNALAIVIINKSGEITFANSGAENILGLSKSKIESKRYNDPIWRHITLDDQQFPLEDFPFAQVLHSKKAVKDIQYGIIWADGSKKYISVTGAPLTFKGKEIEEVIFSVTDITKRVESQKQLDKTKIQMETILKDMVDVVWSVSLPDYKMIYITPSIERLSGFPQSYYLEEYVGNMWEEAVYIRDKHLVETAYKDLEEKGNFQIEYRTLTKDGQLKWVQNKGTIIYDQKGVPLRLDGYISDVSERKAQENDLMNYFEVVEGQNERLKNFTYIVSHNLRSHSANLLGLMHLVERTSPEIFENEYIQKINLTTAKLDETLHQLNDVVSVFSSVEELKQINVHDIIKSLQDAFSNLLNESKVNLINKVDKSINVKASPAYLESVFTNLITNAVKYRDPQKNSYVKLWAESPNGMVNIQVEDNGLGIDLEKYGNKIFGMYKTFHNHKDSRGIGLFLTKNQVESMGGKIKVESEVGVGTTFKVILKNDEV